MSNSQLQPHRGVIVLVLGILSIPFGITGPFAWIMGRNDLAEMDAGRMDSEGRNLTQVGSIIGMIMTIIMILSFLAWIAFFVLFASAIVVSNG